MLNRRVHILFDKDSYNKLIKLSKSQKISVGEFIRRAVKEYSDKQQELINQENPTPFKRFFKAGRR